MRLAESPRARPRPTSPGLWIGSLAPWHPGAVALGESSAVGDEWPTGEVRLFVCLSFTH